jgi:uncharacterized protein YndB with AHSA1/START domain
MNATVREVAGGYALRLERHLRHPIKEVWGAITEPRRMAEWLGSGEIELALGGRIKIVIRAGDGPTVGVVTAFNPPYLLEYTMVSEAVPGATPEPLRWELAPEDGGTRLVLTNVVSRDKASDAPKYQAGWACVADALEAALDGAPTEFSMERWRAYYEEFGGAAKFGSITTTPGGRVLRFERHLGHPIEAVWAALTDSTELPKWFAPADIELRVGGRANIRFEGGNDTVDGRVIAVDPPRLLEYGWFENGRDRGSVRWELTPEQGGTRLLLLHTFPLAEPETLDFAGGWHDLLDSLEAMLSGVERPADESHWLELKAEYEARLGPVPPVQ